MSATGKLSFSIRPDRYTRVVAFWSVAVVMHTRASREGNALMVTEGRAGSSVSPLRSEVRVTVKLVRLAQKNRVPHDSGILRARGMDRGGRIDPDDYWQTRGPEPLPADRQICPAARPDVCPAGGNPRHLPPLAARSCRRPAYHHHSGPAHHDRRPGRRR